MRQAAKWLGLVTLTAVLVPFAEIPGFFKEPWDLMPAAIAQTDSEILLQVEGVLEDGDSVLNDGSLYDAYTFEGRAGQTVAITLESIEFDTFLLLRDSEGNDLARNDDIDIEGYNYHSFITLTLPADGTYIIWANGLDATSRGRYRLTVVKTIPAQAAPLLSKAALQQVEANRLLQQGIQQFNVSQFREAMQSWERALELYREIDDSQGKANASGNLGTAYESLGQYQHAINFYEQSLVTAREIDDRQGEGNALGNLGNAYRSLGQYQRAISFYEQHLLIAREIGDRQGEGIAIGNLGVAYDNLGDYRRAIELHEQSLVIARESDNRAAEGRVLGNLGNAYFSLGSYSQAIELHEQSLAVARQVSDQRGVGAALGNLGLTYDSLGDYRQAIEFHEQSLAVAREVGNQRGAGAVLVNLGNTYRTGQWEVLCLVTGH